MLRHAFICTAAVLSIATGSTAFGGRAKMFPVAPGGPGGGVWKVEQWPDSGCTNCKIDQADADGFRKFLVDLTKPSEHPAEIELPVHVVRGGMDEGRSSFAELTKKVAICKVGAAGILVPNATTDIVAFGVRLDCEDTHQSSFMSVVMGKAHVPVAVYLLPDGPIISL